MFFLGSTTFNENRHCHWLTIAQSTMVRLLLQLPKSWQSFPTVRCGWGPAIFKANNSNQTSTSIVLIAISIMMEITFLPGTKLPAKKERTICFPLYDIFAMVITRNQRILYDFPTGSNHHQSNETLRPYFALQIPFIFPAKSLIVRKYFLLLIEVLVQKLILSWVPSLTGEMGPVKFVESSLRVD